jgi:hypothetical protein
MVGKIKAGLGNLVGNAGEFYVMAELLKRGKVAGLTPRNTSDYDILATDGTKTPKVRVKTKSEEYDIWQWKAKKDDSIFRNIGESNDFTILVNLTMDHREMDYYIIPTFLLNEWLQDDFLEWLNRPGKDGRPHSPDNRKRHLNVIKHQHLIVPFLNDWEILWR